MKQNNSIKRDRQKGERGNGKRGKGERGGETNHKLDLAYSNLTHTHTHAPYLGAKVMGTEREHKQGEESYTAQILIIKRSRSPFPHLLKVYSEE